MFEKKPKKPMKKNVFNIMAVLMTVAFMWAVITPGAHTEEEIAEQDRWVGERLPRVGVGMCGQGGMFSEGGKAGSKVWRADFRKNLVEKYWDDVPETYVRAGWGERFSTNQHSAECKKRGDIKVFVEERMPYSGACRGAPFYHKNTPAETEWRNVMRVNLISEYLALKEPPARLSREESDSVRIYAGEDSDLCKGEK